MLQCAERGDAKHEIRHDARHKTRHNSNCNHMSDTNMPTSEGDHDSSTTNPFAQHRDVFFERKRWSRSAREMKTDSFFISEGQIYYSSSAPCFDTSKRTYLEVCIWTYLQRSQQVWRVHSRRRAPDEQNILTLRSAI